MVLRDHGPAVGQQSHVTLAGIHHGLHRERHSALQLKARTGLAVVQNLGILVIHAADAVAAVFAHNRIIALFHERLNRVSDIAQPRARLHGFDSTPHRFETGFRQPLRMRRRLAGEIHPAGIAMESIANHSDIDVDDVAGLEPLVIRNSVTHHVIHGSTDRLRKPAVIEVRGNRALHIYNVVVADLIELFGGDTGHDVLANHVEHLRGQASGHAHFFLLFRGLYGHVHSFSRGLPVGARKALFRLDRHAIKRGLFWQRNPTRASSLTINEAWWLGARDVNCALWRERQGWLPGMRGGPTQTLETIYARRVNATDAGSGRPFWTSDPLLEPEDGPFHLWRTQQNPHHQPREDTAAVYGGCELRKERHCRRRHCAFRRHQALGARGCAARGASLRPAVREPALAGRHDDELQDHPPIHQAA